MRLSTTLFAAAALGSAFATADDLAAKAGTLLNPFPSARKVGDTVTTTLYGLKAELEAKTNKTVALPLELQQAKEDVSDKIHTITNGIRNAASPLGGKAVAAWEAISAAQYAAWVKGGGNETECKPGAGALKAGLGAKGEPLSFAFQGSGTLLPFYFGVVQGLQDKGVMTPEVAASAQFGGLSGGAITSVFTALGYSGKEMTAILAQVYANLLACLVANAGDTTKCPLFDFVIPGIEAAINAKGPDAHERVAGRVTLWTCQVDSQGQTNLDSVTMGTSKWTSNADLALNIRASASIPCFSVANPAGPPYTNFRGLPMIDGGYCSSFAQLCPKGISKCLKVSTAFIGPNLEGTPYPTAENCKYVVPPDQLPNPTKPFYTPSAKVWTPRPNGNGTCESVPFVVQYLTAKPDIYPFFYSPLPTDTLATACDWLSLSLNSTAGAIPANIKLMFDTGYAAAAGWSKQEGYC